MRRFRVLVTGGAGYIGAHVVRGLDAAGFEPVIFDNLVYGHHEAVGRFPPIEADLTRHDATGTALADPAIVGVEHLAAFAYVGESVHEPAKYYRNNVLAALTLLDAMRQAGRQYLIVSSSCAIYGRPVYLPMDESHPQSPLNPYGRTKRIVEEMIIDSAHDYGLRYTLCRYFNAAGASRDWGEDHDPETYLIPLVLGAAQRGSGVTIFGTDYPTHDGTCVRDQVHVSDLAAAHAPARDWFRCHPNGYRSTTRARRRAA